MSGDAWWKVQRWMQAEGIREEQKANSAFMRLLGALVGLVPGMSRAAFMTQFATVWGETIYWPDRRLSGMERERLALHECTHIMDRRRMGAAWFSFAYAFPQILALLAPLAILAVWHPAFLLALVGLVGVVPGWAPGRTRLEMRGYAVTMQVMLWQGYTLEAPPTWIVEHFTGPSYGFMALLRGRGWVEAELGRYLALAKAGRLAEEIPEVATWRALLQGGEEAGSVSGEAQATHPEAGG